MSTARILLVYCGAVPTDDLDVLKKKIIEKYQNDKLPIYHVSIDNFQTFITDAGKFDFVFLEESLSRAKIEALVGSSTRIIEGVTLENTHVKSFLSSL